MNIRDKIIEEEVENENRRLDLMDADNKETTDSKNYLNHKRNYIELSSDINQDHNNYVSSYQKSLIKQVKKSNELINDSDNFKLKKSGLGTQSSNIVIDGNIKDKLSISTHFTGTIKENNLKNVQLNLNTSTINRDDISTPDDELEYDRNDSEDEYDKFNVKNIKNQIDQNEIISKLEKELFDKKKNKLLLDLDIILPGKEDGYEIVDIPEKYKSNVSNEMSNNYQIPKSGEYSKRDISNIELNIREDEAQNDNIDSQSILNSLLKSFQLNEVNDINEIQKQILNDDSLTLEERKEKTVMILLYKIKYGTGSMKKTAIKNLVDKAKYYGAKSIITQLLTLLMNPTIDIKERHIFIKVLDKIIAKLGNLVNPFVNKIILNISPMLIDKDYYIRSEGKETIGNLAKVVGLPVILANLKQDFYSEDEYVRNLSSKILAVVASSLGIINLIPFIKAAIFSKSSGINGQITALKTVQQISISLGNSILPYLSIFIEICSKCLTDENQLVRMHSANTIAILAESSFPYGVESFIPVVKPILEGLANSYGKSLISYLKAIGFIIPLMDSTMSLKYVEICLPKLKKDFSSNDDEIKRTLLSILKQWVGTPGVKSSFIKNEILEDFILFFWDRRMCSDKRSYKLLIDTAVEISGKIGSNDIIKLIYEKLYDENINMKRLTIDAISKIVELIGLEDFETKYEELLIDALLLNFQNTDLEDQSETDNDKDSNRLIKCICFVIKNLKQRAKNYISIILGIFKFSLKNSSARIRMNACDLVSKISESVKSCGFENLLLNTSKILNEQLSEEFPEVLGSVLGALKSILVNVGVESFDPPIKEFLPKLTPILKNNHVKVQENCLSLVSYIAEKGSLNISAKEWMRICFDLIEIIKTEKKSVRREAIKTFGLISKAIGPQDVLMALLNNLKVQERQYRVSTTISIAVVAESCGPFTVLPALMNEYRFPELNVQNGVLKALAFLFEYIGESSRDYIYSIISLIECALDERDQVHRQLAGNVIRNLALNVAGHNCEDALIHLLNYIWPNIFERSHHVNNSVMESIEALRVALGVGKISPYIVQGLFHPARRVRENYWRIFNLMYIGCAESTSYCFYYYFLQFRNLLKKRMSDSILLISKSKIFDHIRIGSKEENLNNKIRQFDELQANVEQINENKKFKIEKNNDEKKEIIKKRLQNEYHKLYKNKTYSENNSKVDFFVNELELQI